MTLPSLALCFLSTRMTQTHLGKSPPPLWEPRMLACVSQVPQACPAPCSSWQASATVEKREGRPIACYPFFGASSSCSQGQLLPTVSSQAPLRACFRFNNHLESSKCTSRCTLGELVLSSAAEICPSHAPLT